MAAHQAPLSLGFSRQEYWSGFPFPSPMHACMLSHFSRVQLYVTLWTAAHQAPLSTGFSTQEYWRGCHFLLQPQYELKIMSESCFKVRLEKSLESPLDCKEIQPVHSEGDQPWDFFGRNDAKAEIPVLWPPHAKS